jgi:pimeloyl-ACP methyl ester carboxylesterase
MKCSNTDSNEIVVTVEPGETIFFGGTFQRSPKFSQNLVPNFWTRLLPDAFWPRLFAGRLWDLHVQAVENRETVQLGGNDPKGRFAVVDIEAGRKMFLRLRYLAAYGFGPGGGFSTSWKPWSPSRWILRAVSAVTIRGPATLFFYGIDLKSVIVEAGGHSFADQVLAFDATAPFRLHGLLPEGTGPAAHATNASSTTVDLEFVQKTAVVKTTVRGTRTNGWTRLMRLLIFGLLGGWLVERVVIQPPGFTTPPAPVVAFTGKVNNWEFSKDDFRHQAADPLSSETLLARRMDSVGLERLAIVQGSRAMWWLPGITGNQLHDDPDGTLITLFDDAYRHISSDPGFEDVKSAMPWCFAGVGSGTGNGFVYLPASLTETKGAETEIPTIVFLHGYGGSLLWNLWALKASFPSHVILMPSGGIQWADQDSAAVRRYVDHMLTAVTKTVKQKHGIALARPWLFALSQGGPTGFRLACEYPNDFAGYVALATWSKEHASLPVPLEFPILMVNGDEDKRVTIRDARNTCDTLQSRGVDIRLEILINADHFFFLSQREGMGELVSRFMAEKEREARSRDEQRRLEITNSQRLVPAPPPPPPPVVPADLVGSYEAWRPNTNDRVVWFTLKNDQSFTARTKADDPKKDPGLGWVTQGWGHWYLRQGKLTIVMERVGPGSLVPHEEIWIEDAEVTIGPGDRIELKGYNPLIRAD